MCVCVCVCVCVFVCVKGNAIDDIATHVFHN